MNTYAIICLQKESVMAFNQREYTNDYNKNTYKMYPFRVKQNSTSIIEKLKSVPSMNAYVLSLIENDINPGVLTLKMIKDRILPVLSKHNISEVYLFGSYARGEANRDSDLDIYCEKGDIKSFIDQVMLEDELKNALGKDVDIVFIGSRMDDFFKSQLEGDKIRIC